MIVLAGVLLSGGARYLGALGGQKRYKMKIAGSVY